MSKSKKHIKPYFDDDDDWEYEDCALYEKSKPVRIDRKSKILDEYDTPDKPIKSKWKK